MSLQGSHALLDQFLLAHGEVEFQFLRQVTVGLPALDQRLEAEPQGMKLLAEHGLLLCPAIQSSGHRSTTKSLESRDGAITRWF
jgi:hypothetical protein